MTTNTSGRKAHLWTDTVTVPCMRSKRRITEVLCFHMSEEKNDIVSSMDAESSTGRLSIISNISTTAKPTTGFKPQDVTPTFTQKAHTLSRTASTIAAARKLLPQNEIQQYDDLDEKGLDHKRGSDDDEDDPTDYYYEDDNGDGDDEENFSLTDTGTQTHISAQHGLASTSQQQSGIRLTSLRMPPPALNSKPAFNSDPIMMSNATFSPYSGIGGMFHTNLQSCPGSGSSSQYDVRTHETVYVLGQSPPVQLSPKPLEILERLTEERTSARSAQMDRPVPHQAPKQTSLSPVNLLPPQLSRHQCQGEQREGQKWSYAFNHIPSTRNVSGDQYYEVVEKSAENPTFDVKLITSSEEIDRVALHESFMRSGAIHRPNDLEMIKQSLSRSKSTSSKPFNRHEANESRSPMLFSQGYLRRKSEPCILSKDDFLTSNGRELGQDGVTKDEDELSEFEEGHSNHFNMVTNETELNCIKEHRTKMLQKLNEENTVLQSKFIQKIKDSAPFRAFYKAQDPELNVHTATDGAPNEFLGRKLSVPRDMRLRSTVVGDDGHKDDPEAMTKTIHSPKRNTVLMWIFFLLLMILLCLFIPLLVISMRGSDSVVVKYLNNISPHHRSELLQDYYPGNNMANYTHSKLRSYSRKKPNLNKVKVIQLKPGSSIAGITSFSNIPIRYQRSPEIRSLMNNDNLRNVFYGIDYSPRNVIYPACGVTVKDVILDVALLSQVTSRIRTYGTQCNQSSHILDAIKLLNLNVSLSLGVWIGSNHETNNEQIEDMKAVLRKYPRKHFESIFVGNEVLFREDQPPEKLIEYIVNVKDFVQRELKWDLPVGTSELGSRVNSEVMKHCDFYGSNTHPFFSGEDVSNGTKWTFDFLKYQVDPYRQLVTTKDNAPRVLLSEVGWPYNGGQYHSATAGKEQMQMFMDDFVCHANDQKRPWYFFEAFDEPWKEVYHRANAEWETEWGVFAAYRRLKEGIVLPKCSNQPH